MAIFLQIRVPSNTWLAAVRALSDREKVTSAEWLRRLLYAKFEEGGVLDRLDGEDTPALQGRPSLKALWRQPVVSSSPMKIGSPTYHALLRSEDIIGPLTERQRRELSDLLQQFRDTAKTDGIPEAHRPVYHALLRIEDIVGPLTERQRRELSDLLRDFRFAAKTEAFDEARDARVAD
jgi:hypothetical protein